MPILQINKNSSQFSKNPLTNLPTTKYLILPSNGFLNKLYLAENPLCWQHWYTVLKLWVGDFVTTVFPSSGDNYIWQLWQTHVRWYQ